MVDYRPSSGSCARCRAALGLVSVREGGVWYCSQACAEGRPSLAPHPPAVSERRLYNRPLRFFRKRLPKELNAAATQTS